MSHRVKEEGPVAWNQNHEGYGHHPCGNLEKSGPGKTCLRIQEKKKVKSTRVSASRHAAHKKKAERHVRC